MKSVGAKNELTFSQFNQIMDKLDAEAEADFANEVDGEEGEGEDDELTDEELEEFKKEAFKNIKTKKTGTVSAKAFADFLEENEEGRDAAEVKEVRLSAGFHPPCKNSRQLVALARLVAVRATASFLHLSLPSSPSSMPPYLSVPLGFVQYTPYTFPLPSLIFPCIPLPSVALRCS